MIFLLFLFFCEASASSVGNPALPSLLDEGFCIADTSWTNPQCGVLVDCLFEKRLKSSSNIHQSFLSGTSEMGQVIWNIRERFNLQAQLGSGQYTFRYRQKGDTIQGGFRGGLLFGGDAKLIIFNAKDTTFALDAQVGGWHWMKGASTLNETHQILDVTSQLRYWQLGVGLSQKISIFSPYIGLAVNRISLEIVNPPWKTRRLHARHNLGPFGGCSIGSGNRFLLNCEWRAFFEYGLSVSGQIRF